MVFFSMAIVTLTMTEFDIRVVGFCSDRPYHGLFGFETLG